MSSQSAKIINIVDDNNASMELDHIFIFTEFHEQVANRLHNFGLTEGSPNIHPGQGTSCRRFFFENAYLEIVWVSNEEEIKSPAIAATRLWERSRYKHTNYCPFGMCFRNKQNIDNNPVLLFEDGWKYKPPYLPEGLYVNIASNSVLPAEPMLFEMPFFGIAPKDYPAEKLQPLHHQKEFKEITKLILTLPVAPEHLSASMQNVIDNSIVALSSGSNFSVTLEFDHCIKGETHDFTDLVPLSVRW